MSFEFVDIPERSKSKEYDEAASFSEGASVSALSLAASDSPLPPFFISGTNAGVVSLYNIRSSEPTTEATLGGDVSFAWSHHSYFSDAINDVALSGDSSRTIVALEDGSLQLLDTATFSNVATMRTSVDGSMTSCCFTVQSNIIIAGTNSGTVFVYDARASRRVVRRHCPAHASPVSAVAAHPDGTVFLSAGVDGIARVWDASGPLLATIVGAEERGLGSAVFSHNGRYALLGSLADGYMGLWDLAYSGRLKCVRKYSRANTRWWMKAVFMEDGTIVGGAEDGRMLAFDASSAKVKAEMEVARRKGITVPIACSASKGLVVFGGVGSAVPFMAKLVAKPYHGNNDVLGAT